MSTGKPPLPLPPDELARQEGLEPSTHGLEGRCSIQLSYWRLVVGETGFEPATSSSQNWRATRLRHSPQEGLSSMAPGIMQELSTAARAKTLDGKSPAAAGFMTSHARGNHRPPSTALPFSPAIESARAPSRGWRLEHRLFAPGKTASAAHCSAPICRARRNRRTSRLRGPRPGHRPKQ